MEIYIYVRVWPIDLKMGPSFPQLMGPRAHNPLRQSDALCLLACLFVCLFIYWLIHLFIHPPNHLSSHHLFIPSVSQELDICVGTSPKSVEASLPTYRACKFSLARLWKHYSNIQRVIFFRISKIMCVKFKVEFPLHIRAQLKTALMYFLVKILDNSMFIWFHTNLPKFTWNMIYS